MSKHILGYGDRGPRVAEYQRLHNRGRFYRPRRKLVVDGEAGPLTCAAMRQDKYWAGYASEEIGPIAGERLMGLLRGAALTDAMKRRRARRLKKAREAAARRPLRLKALDAARADLGVVEVQPNTIKYNEWWCGEGRNDHEPYCVRAGSYWYRKAGSEVPDPAKGRYQGTDYLLECAKRGEGGVHLTDDPEPGCLFVIDFDGHADPDHCGIFEGDRAGSEFGSIEANATLPSGAQGVGRHVRPARCCWFIVLES